MNLFRTAPLSLAKALGSALPGFKLEPDQEAALESFFERQSLGKSEVMFSEGEPEEYLAVILNGEIELTKPSHKPGQRLSLSLGPGAVFGETALFLNSPREATALAKSDSSLAKLSKEAFKKLEQSEPSLAYALLSGLAALMSIKLREASGAIIYGFSGREQAARAEQAAPGQSWGKSLWPFKK